MFNLCMNCDEKIANQKIQNVAFFNSNHYYTEKAIVQYIHSSCNSDAHIIKVKALTMSSDVAALSEPKFSTVMRGELGFLWPISSGFG